jgi:hypothetical protein
VEKVSRYEQYAADCRELADQTQNTKQKKRLEEMAEVWERLAREYRQGIVENNTNQHSQWRVSSSGNLAIFTAIRLASSRVSNVAADLRPASSSK